MLFFKPNIDAMRERRDVAGLVRVFGKYPNPIRQKAQWAIVGLADKFRGPGSAALLASGLTEAEALRRRDSRAADEVTAILIRCLAESRDPAAFEVLLKLYDYHEEVLYAFVSLGDERALPAIIARLEKLLTAAEKMGPVTMEDVSMGKPYRLLNPIRNTVSVLGKLGNHAALQVLERCREIKVTSSDSDARSNMTPAVAGIHAEVDDAIRAITGVRKTSSEMEMELRTLIHEILGGREHSGSLKARLQKLGPASLPVFIRVVETESTSMTVSFAVRSAVEDAKEHFGIH